LDYLKEYSCERGNANVPQRYRTEDDYRLGLWVGSQRQKKVKLSPKQISDLESIKGWAWNGVEEQWENGFSYLEQFVQEMGHARVPSGYKTTDGFQLDLWVNRQRKIYTQLSDAKKARLESLSGWILSPFDYKWEQAFCYLKDFLQKNGHLKVPHRFKTTDGFSLGQWLNVQKRNKEKLTIERLSKLESLSGWNWM